MSLYTVRWSKERGYLAVTDPWGEVHLVSASQEAIPRDWRREAGEALAREKATRSRREPRP